MNGKSPTADNTKSAREAISRTRRVHNSTEVRKSVASIESRETHKRGRTISSSPPKHPQKKSKDLKTQCNKPLTMAEAEKVRDEIRMLDSKVTAGQENLKKELKADGIASENRIINELRGAIAGLSTQIIESAKHTEDTLRKEQTDATKETNTKIGELMEQIH